MLFADFDDETYRHLEFPPAPAGRPFVFVNMVTSIDGKAVVEETEKGLGSAFDQHLMRRLRSYAGLVLNGAGTLRKSGAGSRIDDASLRQDRESRGLSPNPIASIVTNSGGFDLRKAFFTAADFEAVVFVGPGVAEEEAARLASTGRRVIPIRRGSDGIGDLLRIAREDLGVERLLLEGGPTLNAAFLAADAVDEFFVTVGGRIVGGVDTLTIVEGTRLPANALPQFEPVSIYHNRETHELYCRWRRLR